MAAEFLIENMPFHFSYSGKELEKYRHYFERLPHSWRGAHVRPRFPRGSGRCLLHGFPCDRAGRKVVKADYLICNIDLAFEVWRGQPWGKNVSFRNFLNTSCLTA